MTTHTNSGLKLYMESAIAAAKTLTAITNANPGVISSTAHGYSNGDIVLLEVQGMSELQGRLFKVVSVATDSFRIADIDGSAGIDTTLFGIFSAGTAKKVTLGTTINGVKEFSPAGGEMKTVDTTEVSDTQDTEVVVGASAQSYNLTMKWNPGDAAQQAMKRAFVNRANKGFKILWPSGAYVLFYGTVGYTGAPGGSNQGLTTAPAKISMAGALTEYAA